ncbi:MAG TPA: ABC transporter ATP-binding protein [Eubacteriales bacterium]|nr:ABC transporter ATP-binding protein [Eubacteriales bacterium]
MKATVANDTILKVENLEMLFPLTKGLLSRQYASVRAVDNISFEVTKGKTFGLVGESGCGKTTTGKCILRILEPTAGRVLYNGVDITKMPRKELKQYRRELQMIFQDPYGSLDPRQSASSMLKEALTIGQTKKLTGEINDRIEELLVLVGLNTEMKVRYPHELSGGQRQRLGIARALACDPKLIVCDEPVSALDVSIQAQIINLFERLQEELELTYVFVAHDLAVVRHIAERIGVMYLGHLVEVLDSSDLFQNSMHPYTKALLSAVPTIDYYAEKSRNRILLEGEVPSPINAPSGCPFHPRCKYATEQCKKQRPELTDRGGEHMVACHNV